MKRSWCRSWTALVAAYALALQTLFLAASLSAQAAQVSGIDPHVICSVSGGVPDAPVHHKAAHQADCCVLGGNMLGKLLAPSPATILVVRQAKAASRIAAVMTTPSLARSHSPLTARGPPVV